MKNWRFDYDPSAIATSILTGFIGLAVIGYSSPAISTEGDRINSKSTEKPQVILASSTNKSQDLPLRKGMIYGEARQVIIEQGWNPNPNVKSNLRSTVVKAIFDRGYIEIEDCSGTGEAPCRYVFVNQNGDLLYVVTAGRNRLLRNWWIEQKSPEQTEAAIASYQGLIPDGWIVEQQTLGDLNGDGQSDMVLKLIQSGTDTNRKRSLQVLLSTLSGWQKLAYASKILLCASCGGVMGTENGSHIRVEINDGILVLYQLRGSREAMQTIHRFWIDRNSQELVCIGEDINSYDRVNGNKITDSRNFLTGKRIILESRGKRSNSQAPLRSLEMQISKQLQSIESIDIEEASNSTPSLPLD
ncbi:hypothetical protein [Pseudanabaena sp. BC1403]|uniref:hypothetical protein n=1 Tax=Pseudanabaena sp. BC1403 TaxID=2043171 RepID=UPI000CD99DF1|nr:hypothetical protein [Pseudanabaena sp. BC1403]